MVRNKQDTMNFFNLNNLIGVVMVAKISDARVIVFENCVKKAAKNRRFIQIVPACFWAAGLPAN